MQPRRSDDRVPHIRGLQGERSVFTRVLCGMGADHRTVQPRMGWCHRRVYQSVASIPRRAVDSIAAIPGWHVQPDGLLPLLDPGVPGAGRFRLVFSTGLELVHLTPLTEE